MEVGIYHINRLISYNIEESIWADLVVLPDFEFSIDWLSFKRRIISTKRNLQLVKSWSFLSEDQQSIFVDLEIIADINSRDCEEQLGHILFIDVDSHNSSFSF